MLILSRYGAVTRPIATRLAPALAVVAVTLLAGAAGRARTGAWHALGSAESMAVTGLQLAGAAGLLACHIALLSARASPSRTRSALPAALIAGSLPGLAVPALLVPFALCGYATFRSGLRPAAGLGLAGIGIGIGGAWLGDPAIGTAASLAMLTAATLAIFGRARPSLNDNLPVQLLGEFWILPDDDTDAPRASSPGLGE